MRMFTRCMTSWCSRPSAGVWRMSGTTMVFKCSSIPAGSSSNRDHHQMAFGNTKSTDKNSIVSVPPPNPILLIHLQIRPSGVFR